MRALDGSVLGARWDLTRYGIYALLGISRSLSVRVELKNRRYTLSSITHNNIKSGNARKTHRFREMGSSRVLSPKLLFTSKGSPPSKRYLTPTTTLPLPQKLLSPRSSATSQTSGHRLPLDKTRPVHHGQRQQLAVRLRAKNASSDHYISRY